MPKIVGHLCQFTGLMVSRLLLLPWCSAITGCWISSDNSHSQQQLAVKYRQTIKLLPGTSWPPRVKLPQKEYTCDNSSMLTICLLFYVQSMI